MGAPVFDLSRQNILFVALARIMSHPMRFLLILSGVNGFCAVLLGAFGAHGLESWLAGEALLQRRLGWWQTASLYHLVHALALGIVAQLVHKSPKAAKYIGFCFQGGIILFSGSLYFMTLTGIRSLSMLTPVGGLLLLVGWAAVTMTAHRWTG